MRKHAKGWSAELLPSAREISQRRAGFFPRKQQIRADCRCGGVELPSLWRYQFMGAGLEGSRRWFSRNRSPLFPRFSGAMRRMICLSTLMFGDHGMIGKSALFGLLLLCVTAPAWAQEWADKLFETRTHDFGSVAHYAKVEYEFIFTNTYLEDVHVADARPSCSCTSVQIKNPLVKTYEEGLRGGNFQHQRLLGYHAATITVTIDRPFRPPCRCRSTV